MKNINIAKIIAIRDTAVYATTVRRNETKILFEMIRDLCNILLDEEGDQNGKMQQV